MAYQEFTNLTNVNIQTLLDFPNRDFANFYPLFLFTLFLIFASLTYFRETKREARGNILSSLAVSSFVTLAIATILTYLNLIARSVMIFTMVATIFLIVLFLLTNKNR